MLKTTSAHNQEESTSINEHSFDGVNNELLNRLLSEQEKAQKSNNRNYPSAPFRPIQLHYNTHILILFLESVIYSLIALAVCIPVWIILIVLIPLGFTIKLVLRACQCVVLSQRQSSNAHVNCYPQPVDTNDLQWLQKKNHNKQVYQALVTMEKGLEIGKICELINTKLVLAESDFGELLYPRLTQKIIYFSCSGYCWTFDDNFAVENHVQQIKENICTQYDLQAYVSSMANKEMSFEKPLWEIHVLFDYGTFGDTLLMIRIHPVITDGISLLRILSRSLTDGHTSFDLKPRFGNKFLFLHTLYSICIGPLVFLQNKMKTTESNPLQNKELSGENVVAWSSPLSLVQATRLKEITRSTINDLFLAISASTLRTFLQQRKGIQNPYNVLANIPVDMGADRLYIKMGTGFCFNHIILPTNTEGVLPKLWEVKMNTDEFRNSPNAQVMFGAWWIAVKCLPICLCYKLWNHLHNQSICTISNLQGPDQVVSFCSKKIKSLRYWMPPQADQSLSISFLTYNGRVHMTVIADKAVIPNAHELTEIFDEKIRQLTGLLAHRYIPGDQAYLKLRLSDLSQTNNSNQDSDQSISELHAHVSSVNQQLSCLKSKLASSQEQSDESAILMEQVEALRQEFRGLIEELRKRESATDFDENVPFMSPSCSSTQV